MPSLTFNPNDYEDPKPHPVESKHVYVEKGKAKYQLEMRETKRLLKILRQHSNVPITRLTGEASEAFKRVVGDIHIFHTSTSYVVLYEFIREIFEDCRDVLPGTVGAYFYGCHLENSIGGVEHTGCSAICAGSAPPNDANWSSCVNPVILALPENGRFNLSLLHAGKSDNDKKVAYIFLTYSTYAAFPGFTSEDKKQLRSWGIETVKLRGYREDGKSYIALTERDLSLSEVKSRAYLVDQGSGGEYSFLWLFVLVFIILIVLAVVFALSRRRQ